MRRNRIFSTITNFIVIFAMKSVHSSQFSSDQFFYQFELPTGF